MERSSIGFWVGIIAIVLLGGFVWKNYRTPSTTPDETVKIGAILPLTGWGAYWGEPERRGLELAQQDIEESGGKIAIVVEDGGTDAAKSVTAAQKLINVDKVHGFFTEFTGPASAVAPLSAQYKVPLIYDAVTKKPLSASPYAFKMYFDMDKQCYAAAKTLVQEGRKKIGTALLTLDFNSECKDAVARAIAGSNVQVIAYDFPTETTDFRTIIAKMKQDQIDALIPVFYEDNAIAFFKQLDEQQLHPVIFMGIGVPDGLNEKVRASVPAKAIEGVRTYDQKINESFRDRIVKLYPKADENDILTAAYGYDETMYLYRAISACADKRDAACVTEKMLADKEYVGALDAVHFNADRILNLTPHFYTYTKGKLVEFQLDLR